MMRPRSARPLRTEGAKQTVELALLFNAEIGRRFVGAYTPAMAEPQGDSTGGGKLARQAITLTKLAKRPVVLAIGAADAPAKTCSLRTFDVLERMHAARYGGRKLDLDRHGYAELFVAISDFMRQRGLEVVIDNDPGEDAEATVPESAPDPRTKLVIAGVVAALVALVIAFALLR